MCPKGIIFDMTIKRYGLFAALLLLTLSLIPSIQADAQPGRFSPNSGAVELIEKVNALRVSNGLLPYKQNSILTSIAQSHAAYVASTGVLTHFDEQGRRPYQRALDAGYSVAGNLSTGGLLAQAIYSGAGTSEDQVVVAWSANNIDALALLSADYQDIGVGITASNGITYYVLVAASQSDSSGTPAPDTTGIPPILAGTGLPNTQLPDGEIYHTVQKDEALWSIALAYGTTIAELKLINSLATDEIFEGQRLLIRRANTVTPTSTEIPVTATLGLFTSTATLPVTPTITQTPTPLPTAPTSLQNGGAVAGGIVLAALVAAGLLTFLGKRRDKPAD